jgi:hypothetical protein
MLCTRAAQAINGVDEAKLIALSQACGFAPAAIGQTPGIKDRPEAALIQQIRAAWLISLASDSDQSSKLKPLWTALHYWSVQNEGTPLVLPDALISALREWIRFPAQWNSTLLQWSKTAMTPAMELLELTEDGRDHLEHLRRVLQ